mmetsp:Transcript_27247/g.38542  ORF Transcript_27247/g.38542 Transcript_27247/m.38542 type:complete len:137 (+) Transcript_27247:106-516(+)|eukprot:CAMPEP_0202452828 /NCGR_PEP_ID=MMETSP1360-20130828/10943_1 /ASSEMBLY_ACC=CAM_ASM_000848 /TAXON_ID=515479 /ORGANISM="Licmophora paradoxa, Strain CCMP2313" /LENGTH=136 /DNA_ID=CAMNT_0049071761 /DNA_START=107 /DNA_END=517 /DNA_ORIENTATION=+
MSSGRCVFVQLDSSGVAGFLTLTQTAESTSTMIHGDLRGLAAGKSHTVKIHIYGDLSNDDGGVIVVGTGHVSGAFGSSSSFAVEADDDGRASVKVETSDIKLLGAASVIGRSMIIYGGEDGTTKVAAGVIGIAPLS